MAHIRTKQPSMVDLVPKWLPTATADQHVGFRLTFNTSVAQTKVRIYHSGASWYNLFVDGEQVAEGPTRFLGATPYYDVTMVNLPSAGAHTIAIHAHSVGQTTRLLLLCNPFVMCHVEAVDSSMKPISAPKWSCSLLSNYRSQWKRMSTLLGWMENCTVDQALLKWKHPDFDDQGWKEPTAMPGIGLPVPLSEVAAPASSEACDFEQVACGVLWERYGYVDDDAAARFILRELGPLGAERPDLGSPQGLWWRFDAQRCQLLRPVLQIVAPAGISVEVCYCQSLIDGKASPYHPLCSSPSCYLDRYTIGHNVDKQPVTICPLEPRGCRYVEIHITSDDAPALLTEVHLAGCTALARCYSQYHASPVGQFRCPGDSILDRIWRVGAETTRSCVEDTCIDGPCRERGQWLGDSAVVTLPNLVYMYDDIAPIRLCLKQTAAKADANGVFSGNCPNGSSISDYALLWFSGLDLYLRATGDVTAAKQLFPVATRCMDYFLSEVCYKQGVGFAPPGLDQVIDWGYVDNGHFPVNICLNAMLITALTALIRIADLLSNVEVKTRYNTTLSAHTALVKKLIGLPELEHLDDWVLVRTREEELGEVDFRKIGFHGAVFLLQAQVLDGSVREECCQFVIDYLNSMFPINQNAQRLSDPSCRSTLGFYTPYFQTFTFEALLKAGRADDVLDQIKQAWGWALTQSSTWLEVFDPRWEAVHSWSGCPTWQMSKYWLGLSPRFDEGDRHFELALHVGNKLPGCSGKVPARNGDAVNVSWQRVSGGIQLTLTINSAVYVLGWPTSPSTWVQLEGSQTILVTKYV